MARAITRALVFTAWRAGIGLAVWLVLAGGGLAIAGGKTSKVTIETEPPGAKVYFGGKEEGEVCTTPCTVDAPLGETPIIIEAENRRSIIENLVVPRRAARPMKVRYKLEPAVGALSVEGASGATILIDGDVRGKAPVRIDGIAPGVRRVVLESTGKPIYDELLEIEAGGELTLSQAAIDRAAPRPPPAAPPPAIAAAPPVVRAARSAPAFAVAGAIDVGFRQFTYKNNQTPSTQRNDRESGQLLAGPILEIWPTTLLNLGVLPGLALYGRIELGINSQSVTADDPTGGAQKPTSLSTAWRSIEVSLHHRWMIASAGTIEVGAGFTQDQYQFKGDAEQIAIVPDASYNAIRIGGRASLLFGAIEPYVTAENRLVLSGGAMDDRYKIGRSVNGVRGTLGAAMHVGHLDVRIEGGLTLYSWTFQFDSTDDAKADGGSDFIQNMTVAVGYSY